MNTKPEHVWRGRIIDASYHPWTDNESHQHGAMIARRIAYEFLSNGRWYQDPVYDPSDGHYVGDDHWDNIRCQTHLFRVGVESYIADTYAESTLHWSEHIEGAAELVYRRYFARELYRCAALRDELEAMLGAGWEADEPKSRVLRRLMSRGYEVEDLRREVAGMRESEVPA